MLSADFFVWRKVSRKMRDSNPRYPEEGIPDFESSAFGHSANLPFILSDAKVIHFSHLTKYCCYFLTILTPLYRILYYSFYCCCRNLSASMAALAPEPAATTPWR